MKHRIRFLVATTLVVAAHAVIAAPHDGDIVFQTSKSSQSLAVQQATHSRYSHMGVVLFRDGKAMVFEASATVTYTPFAAWTARGSGGVYVIERLKDASVMTATNIEKLKFAAKALEGRPYDLTFEWSDTKMYCSELVWKLYDRALGIQIGKPAKLKDFDLSSPAVKQKLRERYADKPPLDEEVISPQAIFESPLLEQVAQ